MSCEGREIRTMSTLELKRAQLHHMLRIHVDLQRTVEYMEAGQEAPISVIGTQEFKKYKTVKAEIDLREGISVIPEAFKDLNMDL